MGRFVKEKKNQGQDDDGIKDTIWVNVQEDEDITSGN